MAAAICERRRDNGALRIALGCGHSERIAVEPAGGREPCVHLAEHFGCGHLPGGRGFVLRNAGVAERSAQLEAFEPCALSCFPHAEGNQGSVDFFIECEDPVGIGLTLAGGYDLGDIGSVAVAAGRYHLQIIQVGGAFEVVERTDNLHSAFFAHCAEAFAQPHRRFQLQIGESGTCINRNAQPSLRFGFAYLRYAAGGHEGGIGLPEELFYLVIAQLAGIQPDFRHFYLGVLQDVQNLVVCLVLNAGADHKMYFLSRY